MFFEAPDPKLIISALIRKTRNKRDFSRRDCQLQEGWRFYNREAGVLLWRGHQGDPVMNDLLPILPVVFGILRELLGLLRDRRRPWQGCHSGKKWKCIFYAPSSRPRAMRMENCTLIRKPQSETGASLVHSVDYIEPVFSKDCPVGPSPVVCPALRGCSMIDQLILASSK